MSVSVAVLEDYQGVALSLAPWSSLDAAVSVFRDHVADEDALVERLAGFDVVVAMRERTPFPRPCSKAAGPGAPAGLLGTTGHGRCGDRPGRRSERGVVVCGTGGVAPRPPSSRGR